MKVMEINSSCETGSTGRNVLEIAEYLNHQDGIECYIAHTSGTHYEREYLIGNVVTNKVHALLSRLLGWQEVYSVFATRKLVKYIISNHFNVVHVNNAHSNYINYPYLLRKVHHAGISVVLTLHDCWFYTGKCTHYTKDACLRWRESCGKCPRLKKDIKSWFFDCTRAMLRQKAKVYREIANNLYVVGVSDWITQEAQMSILGCAKEIRRIYNWVDMEIFRVLPDSSALRRKYDVGEDKKILLGVAVGWTEDKGLYDFIELSRRLSDTYEIILVGDDASHEKLPRNLTIVGRTNCIRELVEYYNLADCFLSLSIEESFGKVVAEALACGTPAIVYNSTASPELVGTSCGYVVESHNIDQLVDLVQSICIKGKENYVRACRAFANENFDKDKNIGEYLKLFAGEGGA